MIKNTSHFLTLGLLLGTASSSQAYDREAARAYAIRWSGWIVNGSWTDSSSGEVGKVINETVYGEASDDCANFVSQTLIAGGLKFTAKSSTLQAVGSGFSWNAEKETGAGTSPIKSWDAKKYSRTIQNANNLSMSLVHSRHGGSFAPTPYTSNSSMWTKVKPGDIVGVYDGIFANRAMGNHITVGGDYFKHIMTVTGLMDSSTITTTGKDLLISGHNSQRCNSPLKQTTVGPDWDESRGTSEQVFVIILPDAPIVKDKYVWQIKGGQWQSKGFVWGGKNVNATSPSNSLIGGDGIAVRFTFDTPMDVNSLPQVKLNSEASSGQPGSLTPVLPTSTASFVPIQAGPFNQYGWYIGNDMGGNLKSKTWMGKLYWTGSSFKAYKATRAAITIKAKAVDGSFTDTDNLLNKYLPGENGLTSVVLDNIGSFIKKGR